MHDCDNDCDNDNFAKMAYAEKLGYVLVPKMCCSFLSVVIL